jgi:hypothetical protein
MPRLLQVSPDGGGRYIAVDWDGQLWRGETKRPKEGGSGRRCPRSSRGTTEPRLGEYLR